MNFDPKVILLIDGSRDTADNNDYIVISGDIDDVPNNGPVIY